MRTRTLQLTSILAITAAVTCLAIALAASHVTAQEAPGARETVYLRDGQSVRGELVAVDERVVRFRRAGDGSEQEVGREDVQAIWFHAPGDVAPRLGTEGTGGTASDEPPVLGVHVQAGGLREGLRVVDVVQGGPAEEAGLRAGDLILQVDGIPVRSAAELARVLDAYQPGDLVPVQIRRDDEPAVVPIRLSEPGAETPPGPF